jgi:hypothetical protein
MKGKYELETFISTFRNARCRGPFFPSWLIEKMGKKIKFIEHESKPTYS